MKKILTVLAALLLAGCSSGAGSADYPHYDHEELISKASEIVEVKVVSVRDGAIEPTQPNEKDDPKQSPGGSEASSVPAQIFTVEPIKTFKNDVPTKLQVAQVGDKNSPEAGQYTLKVGESYVLFLETYPDSPASIVGGNQGIFTRTDDGKIKSATSDETYTEEELGK